MSVFQYPPELTLSPGMRQVEMSIDMLAAKCGDSIIVMSPSDEGKEGSQMIVGMWSSIEICRIIPICARTLVEMSCAKVHELIEKYSIRIENAASDEMAESFDDETGKILVSASPIPYADIKACVTVINGKKYMYSNVLHQLRAFDMGLGLDSRTANEIFKGYAKELKYETTQYMNAVSSKLKSMATQEPRTVYTENSENSEDSEDSIQFMNIAIKRSGKQTYELFPVAPSMSKAEYESLIEILEIFESHDLVIGDESFDSVFNSVRFSRCSIDRKFLDVVQKEYYRIYDHYWLYELNKSLVYEEMRCVSRAQGDILVTRSSPFILDLDDVIRFVSDRAIRYECDRAIRYECDLDAQLANPVESVEAARMRLDAFAGGYVADLDLSESYISGSAIFVAMAHVWDHEFMFDTFGEYLEVWWPARSTAPVRGMKLADLAGKFDALNANACPVSVKSQPETGDVTLAVGSEEYTYKFGEGSDVDIAVVADSPEKLESVARKHYAVIRARYPEVELAKHERRWRIISGAGSAAPIRPVEIYMVHSQWRWCTHHLPFARGAYTACGLPSGSAPRFLLAASFLQAISAKYIGNDYRYFASRTKKPIEILFKYMHKIGCFITKFHNIMDRSIKFGQLYNDFPYIDLSKYDITTFPKFLNAVKKLGVRYFRASDTGVPEVVRFNQRAGVLPSFIKKFMFVGYKQSPDGHIDPSLIPVALTELYDKERTFKTLSEILECPEYREMFKYI